MVLGKLEYGDWINWNENEKVSIVKFLSAWWKYDINENSYFDSEVLIEINKVIKDLPNLLSNWNLDFGKQGFKNYIELIENHYSELKSKNLTFKEFDKFEVEQFISWIESNSYKLEEGFFKFANSDKEFSERISNTLYMFERIV